MLRYVFVLFAVTGLAACNGDDGNTRGRANCPGNGGQDGVAGLRHGSLTLAATDPRPATGRPSRKYRRVMQQPMLHAPPEPAPGIPLGATQLNSVKVSVLKANEPFRQRLSAMFADESKNKIDILVLSAGGEFGAFGAGLLNGLTAKANAGLKYDLVTGVSTGALLAPPAFTGRTEDLTTLKENFTTISDEDLIDERGYFSIFVLKRNALYRTEKLRERIRSVISSDLVNEIGRIAREENRRLAVMAVNMDTGEPEVFDLTAIAAGEGKFSDYTMEQRRERIVKSVAASSAIQIGFEPVFIDNAMYGDGGARQHVFFGAEVAYAAVKPGTRNGNETMDDWQETYEIDYRDMVEKQVNMDVVVNGDFRFAIDCTENTLFGIAGRTGSIVVDQLLRDSVENLRRFGRDLRWNVRVADAWRVTTAPGEPTGGAAGLCDLEMRDEDSFFNREFMRCMYRKACEVAFHADDPWNWGWKGEETRPRLPRMSASTPQQCIPEGA